MAVPTWELDELSTHPSYHGTMDRISAETKLREQDGSCYITRYSRTRKVYVLSVIKRKRPSSSGTVKHFKLKIEKQKDRASFEIHGAQRKFNSIAKMLDFYQQTHLNHDIGTIGKFLKNETRFFKPIDLEDSETSPCPASPVHETQLNNEATPGRKLSPAPSVNSSYESKQRRMTTTPPAINILAPTGAQKTTPASDSSANKHAQTHTPTPSIHSRKDEIMENLGSAIHAYLESQFPTAFNDEDQTQSGLVRTDTG